MYFRRKCAHWDFFALIFIYFPVKFGISVQLMAFCMSENGSLLLLHNQNAATDHSTYEYAFPECECGATHDENRALVVNMMNDFGVKGSAGRSMQYASPSEKGSIFYRVYVKELTEYSGNYVRLSSNVQESVALLANHPNSDYGRLLQYMLENPTRFNMVIMNGIYKPNGSVPLKGVIVICTDDRGRILLVKDNIGHYVLPQHMISDEKSMKNRARWDGTISVKSLMKRYGIFGIINVKVAFVQHDDMYVAAYHVLLTVENDIGSVYDAKERFNVRKLSYEPGDRIWLPLADCRTRWPNDEYLRSYEKELGRLRPVLSTEPTKYSSDSSGEASSPIA